VFKKLKKKILPLIAIGAITSSLLVPFDSAFAMVNGLLDGKPLIKSNAVGQGTNTYTQATDRDIGTSVTLGSSSSSNIIWYQFSTPLVINKYYLKSGTELVIKFYDSSLNEIYYNSNPDVNGNYIDITPVGNVSYVAVINPTASSKLVSEFDVFEGVDNIPPNKPTGLVVNGGDGVALLDWNANTENDLAGYNVYISNDNVNFTKLNTELVTSSNYNVTGLTNGETYYFAVTAVDDLGNESERSVSVSVVPSAEDIYAPAEITNLNFNITDTKIDFTWTNPTDTDFDHVNIYKDGVLIGNSTDGTFSVTGLTPETLYTFRFTTVDTTGNESAGFIQSFTTNAEPDTVPPATPNNIKVKAGNGYLYVSWSANTEPDLDGYFVYLDGVQVTTTPIRSTSFTIDGLTNDQTYSIRVSAVDKSGNESSLSSAISEAPSSNALPLMTLGYSLSDVAISTSEWFGSLWLIIAFSAAIPLAFYIGNRVKILFLD
jgi:chitodextrinase